MNKEIFLSAKKLKFSGRPTPILSVSGLLELRFAVQVCTGFGLVQMTAVLKRYIVQFETTKVITVVLLLCT
jgi:hypothetical protein